MSNNAQWKMFQAPESHSSPLQDILDLPSSMQAKQAYRNGECMCLLTSSALGINDTLPPCPSSYKLPNNSLVIKYLINIPNQFTIFLLH